MVSEVTESNSEEECPQEERRAQRMTAAPLHSGKENFTGMVTV